MEKRFVLQNQSGSALVIALIILVVLTLISLSASLTSITEIRLAGNKRGCTDAFADGGSAIHAAMANLNNFRPALYQPLGTFVPPQEIQDQIVNTMLTDNAVQYDSGANFGIRPVTNIYHEKDERPPINIGISIDKEKFKMDWFIIDSIGGDQNDNSPERCRSNERMTVFRLSPKS